MSTTSYRGKWKWKKHLILRSKKGLGIHLPETHLLTEGNFSHMLSKYSSVVIKPDEGMQGSGVLQVIRQGSDRYLVWKDNHKYITYGKTAAFRKVTQLTRREMYLIQQKIHLARIAGRPFDIRVMIHYRPGRICHISGRLTKVAGKGYFVTNVRRSKGYVLPLGKALSQARISGLSASSTHHRIDQAAYNVAKALYPAFSKYHTAGMDLALDTQGRLWLIEVNYRPSYTMFKKLPSHSMYRDMIACRSELRKRK